MDRLSTLRNAHPFIGDVRGRGLLFGVDLVLDRRTKTAAVDLADRVLYACLEQGLSFKVSHGSFLTLTPPLTIHDGELDRAISILEAVFESL